MDHSTISLAAVRDQWMEGLTQYTDMRLHAALSTFKRLLRDLRAVDEFNSPTSSITNSEASPYHTLSPVEVALLYTNIALIHGYLGSYYLSAAAFEEALLLNETSGIVWYGLGIARFYLRELGASRRAFRRCQGCYIVCNYGVKNYAREALTYKVWTLSSEPERKPVAAGAEHASDPWQQFKGIFGREFPDGVWTLAFARVEWNWRLVGFEKNYVRKGVERPGGGKWGLNGIPAGVIFSPDAAAGAREAITRRSTDDNQHTRPTGSNVTILPGPAINLKSRTGSLVRQKWNLLQQKILKRKNDVSIQPVHITPPMSSFSTTFLNREMTSVDERYRLWNQINTQTEGHHPGILKITTSLMAPLTPYPVDSAHNEELKGLEAQLDSNRWMNPPNSPFPLRRSSLRLRSNTFPPGRRRFSGTDIMTHSIESIEEEPPQSPAESANAQDTDYPDSPRSSNISPKTLIPPRRHIEDIMLPTLLSDLAPSPSPTREAPSRSQSQAAPSPSPSQEAVSSSDRKLPDFPSHYPPTLPLDSFPRLSLVIPDQTAAAGHFRLIGNDVYKSEDISPLSPMVRGRMFASLSSSRRSSSPLSSPVVHSAMFSSIGSLRQSSVGHRPSYTYSIHSDTPEEEEGYGRVEELEEEEDDNDVEEEPFQKPSPLLTLTPATPKRDNNGSIPAFHDVSDDSYGLGVSHEQPYSPYSDAQFANDEDMAVKPLNIAKKKERLSITGRACLGEWEWEEEYERWKENEPAPFASHDDEQDDSIGEILLPRRYEG